MLHTLEKVRTQSNSIFVSYYFIIQTQRSLLFKIPIRISLNNLPRPESPSVNTCNKPDITNGAVDPVDSTVDYLETYSLTCDTGYTASSEYAMNCTADGTLDVTHTCESQYLEQFYFCLFIVFIIFKLKDRCCSEFPYEFH